jgi:hypothetical protein
MRFSRGFKADYVLSYKNVKPDVVEAEKSSLSASGVSLSLSCIRKN